MTDTTQARELYGQLTGDLAKTKLELARTRQLYGPLAEQSQAKAESSAGAIRTMRGSALERQYQDDLQDAMTAKVLGGRP